MSIVYPKALETTNNAEETDDLGWRRSEKKALQMAMVLLNRRFRSTSRRIYFEFFDEYLETIEIFRDAQDRIRIDSMRKHSKVVLELYDELANRGLYNISQLYGILTVITDAHTRARVGYENSSKLLKFVENVILQVVEKHRSPTLQNALTKLADLIVSVHKRHTLLAKISRGFLGQTAQKANLAAGTEDPQKKEEEEVHLDSIVEPNV